MVRDVTSDLQITNPQLSIDVDRDKAAVLGLTEDQVRSSLYSQFGTRQVATLYTASNQYQVIIENDPKYQTGAADLTQTYIRTTSGRLVPIEAVAKIRQSIGPLQINHLQQLPSVTISFNLKPGVALGDAVKAIQEVEQQSNLPGASPAAFRAPRRCSRIRSRASLS